MKSIIIRVFRHFIVKKIDLIDGGQLWVGGLLTLVLFTLVLCAIVFDNEFINLYPIENASASSFSCDNKTYNARFESTLKILGLPQINVEQKMIDLLDQQNFILVVDFVNTLINCDAASIEGLSGTTWSTLRWSNCTNIDSTLSISIPLPHQDISVKVILDQVLTIGAVRIGLYADEYLDGDYTLKKLHFYRSFYKNGYVLGKNIPLSLTLTKVINETVPMERCYAMYYSQSMGKNLYKW
jgi:hypothetical protein